MRICLITDVYPAENAGDLSAQYMTKLARGLARAGQEVTVLRALGGTISDSDKNIQVVTVAPVKRTSKLELLSEAAPEALLYLERQLGYWHCLKETLSQQSFDVFETTESLCGTLLDSFTRETPAVVRLGDEKLASGSDFSQCFQRLLNGYALSCVDVFSSSGSDALPLNTRKLKDRVFTNPKVDEEGLAAAALEIYASALERFQQKKRPNLYRHGSARMLKSTEDMLALYEKMLYDMLFQRSYRFRLKHWCRMFSDNPQQFFDKAKRRFGISA